MTSETGYWNRILDISPNTQSSGVLILLYETTNTLSVQLAGTNFQTNLTNSVDSQYHNLVWSIDTSGNWSIWVDGVNQNCTTQLSVPNHQTNNVKYINKSAYTNDGVLAGQVDDFRIYNKPLTATEVQTLYNSAFITKTKIDSEYKYYYV